MSVSPNTVQRRAAAALTGLLLFVASACSTADPSSTDFDRVVRTTTAVSAGPTFTGDGDPPDDVAALLRPDDRDILVWGRAAGEPWALVSLHRDGYSCLDPRPLEGLTNCAPPDRPREGLASVQAFELGQGGLVLIRTAYGADRVSFVSPSGSQMIKIHGEAGGYPPTGVLPTPGQTLEGELTVFDADGNPLGESVPFSIPESDFFETPAPA